MERRQPPNLGCVVMAAGNARRFGENKLAAKLDGRPLIEHALDAVPAALFSRVAVVTQYPEVERLASGRGFLALRNRHPDWGISHTSRIGTEALRSCDGILYLVSDQPLLSRDSVARVVQHWLAHPSKIVGAAHNGKRGNPCIFPPDFYEELLALKEDCGGNTVIRAHLDRLELVEIPREELTDVDTPEALQTLRRHAT